ncbi:lipopolysaccharide biosynthesis protein [Methylobacterium iners]|uniref:Polysaccharide biosynthesis protein n=1 Tax=Methylobacterium iners TaxID=418707 RepID=A0ABQ4RT73_9HYPH|nr:polysaccharide biosynthesis C-terminal domain-containing protein [Methylobacterium iners]GJD93965.1 hypothetical protein OCOJLMKI_1163 [Methylobacterium iners]
MLLRKTLLYLPSNALGPLIQLGTILVWTFWLSPADLGIYALVTALQDLVHLASVTWWSQYVLRYLGIRGEETRRIQDRTELAVLAVMGVAQAAIVPGLILLAVTGTVDALLLASITGASVARSIVVHWGVRARAEQRIGINGLAQTLAPALSLVFALLLFHAFAPSLTVIFAGMALGHLVVAALILRPLGLVPVTPHLDREILHTGLRYGTLATLGAVFAWVSMQSVRFTTDVILGTAAVGLMTVGWGIGQRIATQIAVIATAAIFPHAIARAREEGAMAGFNQLAAAGPILIAALLPATVGGMLVAAPLADLLTAGPYREATATILPYAMLAGAFRVFRHHYLDEVLQLAERPDIMTKLDAFEAVATVILCVLGTLLYGMMGGAAGCLAASAVTTVIAIFAMPPQADVRLSARQIGPSVMATAAMAAIVIAMPEPRHLAELTASIAAGSATYALTLAALERRRLRAWLSTSSVSAS